MEEHEALGTGDPYGAIAVWYFDANRDPEKFLRIFEGVAPEIRGMIWTAAGYVAESEIDTLDFTLKLESETLLRTDSGREHDLN